MDVEHQRRPRGYLTLQERKSSGAHYTPRCLANFVAEQIVESFPLDSPKNINVLDPAVGDAELLLAIIEKLSCYGVTDSITVFGYDVDTNAIDSAQARIEVEYPHVKLDLRCEDFLEHVPSYRNKDLFKESAATQYDVIITNPPYVRTQVMGAKQSQMLAQEFGLSGRVDLYYAFIQAISTVLRPGGIAGIIVSNRFMTTKSGASVRKSILDRFEVLHIWDLGDTKLFEAAVLPAVLLIKRRGGKDTKDEAKFTSIYSTEDPPTREFRYPSALEALKGESGVVEVEGGQRYRVQHGQLSYGAHTHGVWRIVNEEVNRWLDTVNKNTFCTFGDIGKIRVGVKTTADKVFIRTDWARMSDDERPELLRPLISHHVARKFKAHDPDQQRMILYTHEVVDGRRVAVDLDQYPRAAEYLEEHRARLEAREYVIKAGRNWYEIWVPHDPDAWAQPKLVFRDIAEEPTFWMDLSGAVVNGDCYWLTNELSQDSDLLWLALAIGNSSFIKEYYDRKFSNKLYANRRRFMTQYVEKFPLPSPQRKLSREIIRLAKEIYELIPAKQAEKLKEELDQLVWRIFGINPRINHSE